MSVLPLLNENSPTIEILPEMHNLFSYQKTVIAAMIDLEKNKQNIPHTLLGGGKLGEPVGSGKTAMMLGVIALTKGQKLIPSPVPYKYYQSSEYGDVVAEITHKHVIDTTLVFVGTTVVNQWEDALKKFTPMLTYFIADDARSLNEFFKIIEEKEVPDVIIIKNGTTTGKMHNFKDHQIFSINNSNSRSIYNLVANYYTKCYKRVIIDDGDVTKTPGISYPIQALMTWFVSSTANKFTNLNRNPDRMLIADPSNFSFPWKQFLTSEQQFGNYNIMNNPEYIKKSMEMPMPHFHLVLTKSPEDKLIGLLAGLDCPENIRHMLNNGAIMNAAKAAGIQTDSVTDIFVKFLGDKFQAYKIAGDILAFIAYHLPLLPNLPTREQYKRSVLELKISEEEYLVKRFNKNTKRYKEDPFTYHKSDIYDYIDPFYNAKPVEGLLKETEVEYKIKYDKYGKEIQKVKENIKHGTCPICYESLAKFNDLFIHQKCGNLFCADCIEHALKDHNRNTCPVCSNKLRFQDFVVISSDKLAKIEAEDFEETNDSEVKISQEIPQKMYEAKKLENMIRIVKGQPLNNDTRISMNVGNILTGTKILPEAPVDQAKTLIFASYSESIENITAELKKASITYWTLYGANLEITMRKFTEHKGQCALVINSSDHCNGMNLQCASNLIFTNRLPNDAIANQVVGRIQRLGIQYQPNIYYLLYQNECEELNYRDLTTKELNDERIMKDNFIRLGDNRAQEKD